MREIISHYTPVRIQFKVYIQFLEHVGEIRLFSCFQYLQLAVVVDVKRSFPQRLRWVGPKELDTLMPKNLIQ